MQKISKLPLQKRNKQYPAIGRIKPVQKIRKLIKEWKYDLSFKINKSIMPEMKTARNSELPLSLVKTAREEKTPLKKASNFLFFNMWLTIKYKPRDTNGDIINSPSVKNNPSKSGGPHNPLNIRGR